MALCQVNLTVGDLDGNVERMAAALQAKGYDYRYVVAENAAHVDGNVIAQTLPGALEWLWRDDVHATRSRVLFAQAPRAIIE